VVKVETLGGALGLAGVLVAVALALGVVIEGIEAALGQAGVLGTRGACGYTSASTVVMDPIHTYIPLDSATSHIDHHR
jgi:hypothetical protein